MDSVMRAWAGIVLGVLFSASIAFHGWQIYRFVNAGPRFTAYDGQRLCERVAALEEASGHRVGSCRFGD